MLCSCFLLLLLSSSSVEIGSLSVVSVGSVEIFLDIVMDVGFQVLAYLLK